MSSVVEGFQEYREAARRGISKAGGEPILVNEDFPSRSGSPRNACLDAVSSADYLVTIVGSRGGWKSPSGLLVVEEEFEHARHLKIPILAFLQNIQRDEDGARFADRVSDYIVGEFRTTFTSAAELEKLITAALQSRVTPTSIGRETQVNLSGVFPSGNRNSSGNTTLRLVVVPERKEEVLDPVRIASEELQQLVYQIAHLPAVALMSYSRPKTARKEKGRLIIDQKDPNGRHDESDEIHLELSEDGMLILEGNVTGRVRRGDRMQLVGSMVIAGEDIEALLLKGFRFVGVLYDSLDPYLRHDRFFMNVGLHDLGYRTLHRNPQPSNSMTMSMRSNNAVLAYEGSRVINRTDLKSPQSEIARIIALLEQSLAES